MKERALSFLILTGLIKVALCFHLKLNIYVPTKMTWSEARQYCREHYIDLSSISNKEEDEKLLNIAGDQAPSYAWIGLYKDANEAWKWAGGKNASFLNWSELRDKGKSHKREDRCAAHNSKGWHEKKCEKDELPFYCSRSSPVLIKENKTWEEALEHCRQQGTDLISLPSGFPLIEWLQIIRKAQTDHVWTGLRYLADNWVWLDGERVRNYAWSQIEVLQCPEWRHRCGALSLEGWRWRYNSWDCADKLTFLCY